jgi:hypothetical protein
MANSLNRNLKRGDKLVMLDGSTVVVDAELFGCFATTSGSAIGIRTGDGRLVKASGHDIDAAQTMGRYGMENGWVRVEISTVCAHCGKLQQTKHAGREQRLPNPGQWCLCGECGEISIFNADGSLRRMTDEEDRALRLSDKWVEIEILRKRISHASTL